MPPLRHQRARGRHHRALWMPGLRLASSALSLNAVPLRCHSRVYPKRPPCSPRARWVGMRGRHTRVPARPRRRVVARRGTRRRCARLGGARRHLRRAKSRESTQLLTRRLAAPRLTRRAAAPRSGRLGWLRRAARSLSRLLHVGCRGDSLLEVRAIILSFVVGNLAESRVQSSEFILVKTRQADQESPRGASR